MIDRVPCSPSAVAIVALALPSGAMAGSWGDFVRHCLDAYESFSPEVTTGLAPVDGGAVAGDYSADSLILGPTDAGGHLILDPAPEDGERSCAIVGSDGDFAEFERWQDRQLTSERYEPDADGVSIISGPWIEPRLRLRAARQDGTATYRIVETDLET